MLLSPFMCLIIAKLSLRSWEFSMCHGLVKFPLVLYEETVNFRHGFVLISLDPLCGIIGHFYGKKGAVIR